MAATTDGACLARLSDMVTMIAEQMAEQKEVQQNILAVLGHLLETNRAQSEMLADILAAATQDAGPSPVAEALEALAAQVQEMDANQAGLIALVAELPQVIGQEFEAGLRSLSAAGH